LRQRCPWHARGLLLSLTRRPAAAVLGRHALNRLRREAKATSAGEVNAVVS